MQLEAADEKTVYGVNFASENEANGFESLESYNLNFL